MGRVAVIVEVDGVGRQGFADQLAARGYRLGVEVGVERGVHAKLLCQRIKNLRLTCVDPWRVAPGYRDHVPQARLDAFYEEAGVRLAPYVVSLWRMTSLEAAPFFPDRTLDFVYLDGDHSLEAVRADIEAWLPKIGAGGMLCGHDYDDVKAAIELRPLTVYGDGRARTWAYEVPRG